jgi:glycerol uptake facilitator protein
MEDFLGEFLGTMILILLGDGVVAGVLLNKSKSQNAGWMVITTGWGFAVFSGVFVAAALGAPGEINPAVALANIIRSFTQPEADPNFIINGIIRMIAQFLGAFVGAVLVYLHYLPHWKETDDPGAKLGIFSTGPAIRNTTSNLISEIIGTFVLVFVVFSIFAPGLDGNVPSPVSALGPFLVGVLVWGIGLSLGGPTGYAINPARDLGPRIAHAILPIPGKGSSDWEYSWIPVVGPFIGGAIAAIVALAIAIPF